MTSHEVALAYGDMRRQAELEAQLASAQAALLLSQADAEALRAGVLAYFVLPHEISDHRLRVQLIDLARAEHPGQALADEVAAGRAIVEEMRPSGNCMCEPCVEQRALYAAYDAAVKARDE